MAISRDDSAILESYIRIQKAIKTGNKKSILEIAAVSSEIFSDKQIAKLQDTLKKLTFNNNMPVIPNELKVQNQKVTSLRKTPNPSTKTSNTKKVSENNKKTRRTI